MTELTLSLTAVPTAGGIARAALRERFAALPRATLANLELVVSELVTNAVEHGHGPVQLEVEAGEREIEGSVSDHGSGFAYQPREFNGTDDHGRGLGIVNALVTRWGVRRGSTHVWFEISVPGT
jgi:anti-sigma regulatory factor (Ser/Thr protein kinase)